MTVPVYCERGALKAEIRNLAKLGKIKLLHFPYEGEAKKIENGKSSLVTGDANYVTADSSVRISDMNGSEKYSEIRSLIGAENEYDVRHIDAAFKNGCACFLTRDKGDILSKRLALETLLGMRFFHPDDDFDAFSDFVETRD